MRTTRLVCLTFGLSLSAIVPALAEAPTPAQQQAIRSNCVSDYRKDCSGVPTGGMDALICLEQHSDSLSPACKSAVEAVEPASAADPETAAKPTESAAPKPAEQRSERARCDCRETACQRTEADLPSGATHCRRVLCGRFPAALSESADRPRQCALLPSSPLGEARPGLPGRPRRVWRHSLEDTPAPHLTRGGPDFPARDQSVIAQAHGAGPRRIERVRRARSGRAPHETKRAAVQTRPTMPGAHSQGSRSASAG